MTTQPALHPVPFPIEEKSFLDVQDRLLSGTRLSMKDAVTLLKSQELPGLGYLAEQKKQQRHHLNIFWVRNRHLNYTNICTLDCRVCAYHRKVGEAGGFLLSPENITEKAHEANRLKLREIHIVGGLHPEAPFSYYTNLLETFRRIAPRATRKAFTAVEILHLAKQNGFGIQETLERLKAAGLEMLPGGGAEIFSPTTRQKLFPGKPGAKEWLEVHRTAHRLGLKSNATLLFGHLETPEEIADHLNQLRQLQDETNGFNAFIPLVFQPGKTELLSRPPATGAEILRLIAVSRLFLDNLPHIRAYWVMMGLKLASVAITCGADDLDGTIGEEKIGHAAGADTPPGLSPEQMESLIRETGRNPVERDGGSGK